MSTILTAPALAALIAANPACTVPGMVPDFWPRVVRAESHYVPTALHDDTVGLSYYPDTAAEAEAIATRLMAAGHSVGVGLSQLTARSEQQFYDKFHLTIRHALETCANMKAGAQHFVNGAIAAYHTGKFTPDGDTRYVDNVISHLSAQPDTVRARLAPPPSLDPALSTVFAHPVVGGVEPVSVPVP